ncbi:MAG TPA: hypothetical protein VGK39_06690, partial [Cyclobacteriaceae bacterium]
MKGTTIFARVILLLTLFVASCSDDVKNSIPAPPDEIDLSDSFFIEINLDDRSDDTFKVRMFVDNLTADNAILQFAATTPGT